MAKNADYWKERFKVLEAASHSYGQRTYSQIEPAFRQAQQNIQKEIDAWYARFAKNNNVTLADAKKLLTSKELAELKWDVNQYIQYGQQNALDGKWMKQLENASAKFHISRLEALQLKTQQAMEAAFGNELDAVDRMARHILTEDYYHSIFEVQKGFNIGWNIGQMNDSVIEKLIVKPWAADGKNFSDRIWQRKQSMIGQLHQELTRTLIQGQSPDKAIRHLEQFVDSQVKNARKAAARLVMTEQAYFHSVSQQKAFKELDVEEYVIIAAIDSHTSDICREMNGKRFPMKEFEAGVTAPPFHPNCRSVTAPYDEDFEEALRELRAEKANVRDVPDDMTYKDWKKEFAQGKSSEKGNLLLTNSGNGDIIKSIDELKINSQPHDLLSDLKATNPNYSNGGLYKTNCGNCAIAYELRRRGYDVEARPSAGSIAKKTVSMFKEFAGLTPKGITKNSVIQDLTETALSWGNNARGLVCAKWKSFDSMHFFSVEIHDNNVLFIDPQSAERNIVDVFDKIDLNSIVFGRVDDLELNETIINAVVNKR